MLISSLPANTLIELGIKKMINDQEINGFGLAGFDLDFPFCTFIDDPKFIDGMLKNSILVVTNPELVDRFTDRGVIVSDTPRITFFKLHNFLSPYDEFKVRGTFKTSIGKGTIISPLAHISDKNVKIGNNVVIEEFVSIKANTIIGDDCIIRAGSIISGEGFEFIRQGEFGIFPVLHFGWVTIGNNVEIQQSCCVDKAVYPWDSTIISDNCKLDNFVHIAHAVKLSKAILIAAGVLTGGRTEIKDGTWVGVGATISNGLIIGKEASVNIGAVVTKNVADGASVSGNFAIDHKKFIEFIKSIR